MSESPGFFLSLTIFVVLLGLIALFLWLSLLPKNPCYTIINLYVPSLDNQNTSAPVNDSTNSTVEFLLEIGNPNKDSGIYYDDTIVTLFLGDDNVGTTTISSFYQGRDNTDQYQSGIHTNRRLSKANSSGATNMKLQTATNIRYKTWGVKSKHHGIDMQGNLRIGSDGKIYGKKKKIKLHHARKKWIFH